MKGSSAEISDACAALVAIARREGYGGVEVVLENNGFVVRPRDAEHFARDHGDEEERAAWDIYAAAYAKHGDSARWSAQQADDLLNEHRNRFGEQEQP